MQIFDSIGFQQCAKNKVSPKTRPIDKNMKVLLQSNIDINKTQIERFTIKEENNFIDSNRINISSHSRKVYNNQVKIFSNILLLGALFHTQKKKTVYHRSKIA